MSFDSAKETSSLPCCCAECDGAGSPMSATFRLRDPPSQYASETDRFYIPNGQHIPSTSTKQPRYPSYTSGKREPENDNTLISSVPTLNHNPSHRAHNRSQRETDGANKPQRRRNDDLPPIPTQEVSLSNHGPQIQYQQETKHADEPRNRLELGNPSMLSVPTSTQERDLSKRARIVIPPKPQQSLETPYNAKPQDRHSVEPPSIPSVPIQERGQSSYSRMRLQPQEIQASLNANKLQDRAAHSTSVSTQDPSRLEETQVSSNVNKPRDRAARSSSISTQNCPQPQVSTDHVNKPRDRAACSTSISTQDRLQPQEKQVSANANESRDHAEHSTSVRSRDQLRDHTADTSKTDTRPHLLHGTPSQMDTQYVNMLLALDDIPNLHNLLAAFFNWILLAGFILFPGTFTSLKNLGASGTVNRQLVDVITSIPL